MALSINKKAVLLGCLGAQVVADFGNQSFVNNDSEYDYFDYFKWKMAKELRITIWVPGNEVLFEFVRKND